MTHCRAGGRREEKVTLTLRLRLGFKSRFRIKLRIRLRLRLRPGRKLVVLKDPGAG